MTIAKRISKLLRTKRLARRRVRRINLFILANLSFGSSTNKPIFINVGTAKKLCLTCSLTSVGNFLELLARKRTPLINVSRTNVGLVVAPTSTIWVLKFYNELLLYVTRRSNANNLATRRTSVSIIGGT